MPFVYTRTIRFQDTDAAGVVYFTNVLAMCHEAYEESLAAVGVKLQSFFRDPAVAIPIVHASVDMFQPMFCGDRYVIHLTPKQLGNEEFGITYQVFNAEVERPVSKGYTRHICIDPVSRTRKAVPVEIIQWLQQWQTSSD